MDVIEEILSEKEILDMPTDVLADFYKVLNTSMKSEISQYMESPKADPEVVSKLDKCFGADVNKSTFHLRIKSNESTSKMRNLSMQDLPTMAYAGDVDLNEIIMYYAWLEENEDNLQADIAGRTKTDYDQALESMQKYYDTSGVSHEHNIPLLMKAYKDTLFCPTREKARSTGVKSFVKNKQKWKMQKRAAEYLKYCLDNNISINVSREC